MSAESTSNRSKFATLPWVSILIAAIACIGVSMIANLIVRAIGLALVDVPDSFDPLASAGPVVMASIMYGLIATTAFVIVRWRASNIRRAWTIIGLIGLAVSFIPPLGLLSDDDSSGAGVVILIIMHIVAAVVFIPGLLRLAGDTRE